MNEREQRAALYPFLYGTGTTAGATDLVMEQVRVSTIEKARDVIALRRSIEEEYRGELAQAAERLAEAFAAGRKLLAFGNGGSATDARDVMHDCLHPASPEWRALPAIALQDDSIITAVANDVGFEHVFARQLIAFGERGDVVIAFSTSGNSRNIRQALGEARRMGIMTIAMVGDNGGAVASEREADFCFVARGQFIPRIQEGHATIWHTMLELVQSLMGRPDTSETKL